jgi:acylphosphatase
MVKNVALGLGIKGEVRNLDDGRVEIFCEAGRDVLERFRKAIDVKGDEKNIFAPCVNKLVVRTDRSTKKQFKTFSIDYSGTDAQAETLERSEMGIVALGAVNTNIVCMHTDLKAEAVKTHGKLDSIDNRLGVVIVKYGEFGEKMSSMEVNMAKLTEQITRLVDHLTGSGKKE